MGFFGYLIYSKNQFLFYSKRVGSNHLIFLQYLNVSVNGPIKQAHEWLDSMHVKIAAWQESLNLLYNYFVSILMGLIKPMSDWRRCLGLDNLKVHFAVDQIMQSWDWHDNIVLGFQKLFDFANQTLFGFHKSNIFG